MSSKHHLNEGTVLSGKRGQHIISAVGPEFVIASQDILYFTGSLHSVRRGDADEMLLGVMDGLQNVIDFTSIIRHSMSMHSNGSDLAAP